jgi:hypothetical protein
MSSKLVSKELGCDFDRTHVNPMLALRNAVCNDRWREMWQEALEHSGQQRTSHRTARAEQRRSAWLAIGKRSLPASASLPAVSKIQALPVAHPTARPTTARSRSSLASTIGKGHSMPKRVSSCHQRSAQMKADVCLCGTPLVRFKGHQSKEYCSNRCRQRAYRERQRWGGMKGYPFLADKRLCSDRSKACAKT